MHLHLHLKCLPVYVSSTFNVLLLMEAQDSTTSADCTAKDRHLGEFLQPVLSMLNYASKVYLHFHPLKMQIVGNI